MKTQKIELKCDVCGNTATMEPNQLDVTGWIEWSTESKYVDRDFTDHHACPLCVEKIVAAEKARSNRL